MFRLKLKENKGPNDGKLWAQRKITPLAETNIPGFNISRSAEILGLARTRIYRKLKQFNPEEISYI
ncbi:MAG: hypothetical protein GY757_14140 [bacterium]|nr:hypothetical protein [bacterium]